MKYFKILYHVITVFISINNNLLYFKVEAVSKKFKKKICRGPEYKVFACTATR